MADLKTHEYHTESILGDKCTPVHKIMDSAFKKYGARHRHKYHHWEGALKVAEMAHNLSNIDFDLAYQAAQLHILLDYETKGKQLPIPHEKDYKDGDGSWPTTKSYSWLDKPFSTKLTDKTLQIKAEHIKEAENNCKEL